MNLFNVGLIHSEQVVTMLSDLSNFMKHQESPTYQELDMIASFIVKHQHGIAPK